MKITIETKDYKVSSELCEDATINEVIESITSLLSGVTYALHSIQSAYEDEAQRLSNILKDCDYGL